MNRARTLLVVIALAAGCSGGDEKPGAILRGPGALAVFDGIVAHESGTIRPYLAVANERGDELRLVDTTDDQVVESPGLVFPLSVPFSGRPLWMAATDLHDDSAPGAHDRPDALVVVAGGSSVVELVDTWGGQPRPLETPAGDPIQVDLDLLAPGAEILSILGVTAPVSATDGSPAPGVGRILVGLSGGRLAVLDFARDPADPTGNAVAAPTVTALLTGLGFDPISLSQGADARFVYAASRTLLPGGTPGVAELDLGALPAWTLRELDALVPTEAVAAVSFGAWDRASDTFGATVPRVFTFPDPSACGEGKPVPCGLLALDPALALPDPATGHLLGNLVPLAERVAGEGAYLLPIAVPAPVTAILATGRATAVLSVTSGAGTKLTSALAAITATDGRAYLVDLARWAMLSETAPLVGTGKTGATTAAATVIAPTSSAIGLLGLDGSAPSAVAADLPARVRVTPGFTPDDKWTLTWQGALPGLEERTARLWRDGADALWLSVQVGEGAAAVSVARLDLMGVGVGDLVALGCADGTELTVAEVVASDAVAPGEPVRLSAASGACPDVLPPTGIGTPKVVTATFRAPGLVLAGAKAGLVGRPAVDTVAPADLFIDSRFAGDRRFYVTDPCTPTAECVANWQDGVRYALTFPFPSGPMIGLTPAFVDAAGVATTTAPSRGTAITFTTASGLVPSGRRPIIDGTAVASSLPSGLAIVPGASAADVWVSYAAGLVVKFSTAGATGSMSVLR